MAKIAPLSERIARYQRMKAMQIAGKSLEEIGAVFPDANGKPLSRQRVDQILAKPPRKPGPPFSARKHEELREKLAFWERRRAARITKGKETSIADEHIAAILAEIDLVVSLEPPIAS